MHFRDGVEFCGYNVPHPLEDKILLRIQTRRDTRAGDVLLQGLKDAEKIFAAIQERFIDSYKTFKETEQAEE